MKQNMRPRLLDWCLAVLIGLALPTIPAARADTTYALRPLVRVGDAIGDIQVRGQLNPGALNDRGDLVFSAENGAGVGGRVLCLATENRIVPIVVGGTPSPFGTWPAIGFNNPVAMNREGVVAFAAGETPTSPLGIFRWDPKSRAVSSVAVKGMPAVNGLTFEVAPGGSAPQINNLGEIAFLAKVRNSAGEQRNGIFLQSPTGRLLPVALPDQELPGGGKVREGDVIAGVSDAGLVSFLVRRDAEEQSSAYLWERGVLTRIATAGQDAPGGGKFFEIGVPRLNHVNREILFLARLNDRLGPRALYRWRNGTVTPVATPGQELPGGGVLIGVQEVGRTGGLAVSHANTLGQHAFLADLKDGRTAAYRVDPDGQLSLIMVSGETTDLGLLVRVGSPRGRGEPAGVCLNSQGQVALSIATDTTAEIVVLLTPSGA